MELDKNESIEDAEMFLAKSVAVKQECSGGERYAEAYLNEFEAYICAEHRKVLKQIADEIAAEVSSHANK